MNMAENGKVSGSFRDPCGFLFFKDGLLYRQINAVYRSHYDMLQTTGLYDGLVREGMLIPHKECDDVFFNGPEGYKIIQPEKIAFISYPYEWSFSQLKDAALLTLALQKRSLNAGMTLKDCSAYNVQFHRGRPIFIDTLSFEAYEEGRPWIAYRQFCQHFLGPLLLMARVDLRLGQLLRIYIDGIPLDMVSKLLPRSTWLRFSHVLHIHLHAKSQKHFADKTLTAAVKQRRVGKLSVLGLIDSLETAVKKLKPKGQSTEWERYYGETNYSETAFSHKIHTVERFLEVINPRQVWDLGANDGTFSRLASSRGIHTVAFDVDPVCVENNYLQAKQKQEKNILPLLLDVVNPSPGMGWENNERESFFNRAHADAILALALVHHLAISNNVPFEKIAHFFSTLCARLIVEFVPKDDSQVQRLLATRSDIFPHYTRQSFEAVFSRFFTIRETAQIEDSKRILYLMENNKRPL